MTFTSDPRLIPLEYMMRQKPRYRPDPSQTIAPEYYIGTYGIYLRKLFKEQCEANASVPDQQSWGAVLFSWQPCFRTPNLKKEYKMKY